MVLYVILLDMGSAICHCLTCVGSALFNIFFNLVEMLVALKLSVDSSSLYGVS